MEVILVAGDRRTFPVNGLIHDLDYSRSSDAGERISER
jgi:predicted hydrolase (HD superfamily)